jgi:uncharacterized protein YifE (UPF0438 family)
MPFKTQKKFYGDPNHFRYGLSRSGEFTLSQVKLLEDHGHAYQALHNGECKPSCDEEAVFVQVCIGAKTPDSPHEVVWAKYCKLINKTIEISAFGSNPRPPSDSPYDRYEINDD